MMWPAILGMTFALAPPGREALAGALIMGAAGFSNAVGPLLGGALTDYASWRWIFFLNLPVAAIAALVTWRVVPPRRGPCQGADRLWRHRHAFDRPAGPAAGPRHRAPIWAGPIP